MNLAPPKGVLFVGVQGCGKSLAAKFIAKQWQMPLLKLDAGRLYEKYVGESEKNFRRATEVAEAMAPVVLWIDEIEKAFASGTSSDADGGLSQRLFASFLSWLQEKKASSSGAATLSRMPPELLRKGRFDEIFFVDLPTREERVQIVRIHLGLRKQDPAQFDIEAIAEVSEGFSGAEIEQAVIAALYRSLHAQQALSTEAVLDAMRSTVPLSVSRREDVGRLREMAGTLHAWVRRVSREPPSPSPSTHVGEGRGVRQFAHTRQRRAQTVPSPLRGRLGGGGLANSAHKR